MALSVVGNIACYLVALGVSTEEKLQPQDWVPLARTLDACRQYYYADAAGTIESLSVGFADLPITRCKAYIKNWAGGVEVLFGALTDYIIQDAANVVATSSSSVDALCPRWGDAINDDELRTDSAKLLLSTNPKLQGLPKQCRALQVSLENLGFVTKLLLQKDVGDVDIVKESARVGSNTVLCGKQMVNVSAACQVLFAATPSEVALKAVLKWRATWPAALVAHSDAALVQFSVEAPVAASASVGGFASAPSASSSTAPKVERAGNGSGSQTIKRSRSGMLAASGAATSGAAATKKARK